MTEPGELFHDQREQLRRRQIERVVELYRRGLTQKQIGEIVGLTQSRVSKILTQARREGLLRE